MHRRAATSHRTYTSLPLFTPLYTTSPRTHPSSPLFTPVWPLLCFGQPLIKFMRGGFLVGRCWAGVQEPDAHRPCPANAPLRPSLHRLCPSPAPHSPSPTPHHPSLPLFTPHRPRIHPAFTSLAHRPTPAVLPSQRALEMAQIESILCLFGVIYLYISIV